MARKATIPLRHPMDKLPVKVGKYRYVSPKSDGTPQKVRGDGFQDRKGNNWEWSPCVVVVPSERNCDHWDVQHPDGNHSNISPDGNVHHNKVWVDNF